MLKLLFKKIGLLFVCLSIVLSSVVVISAEGETKAADIDLLLLNRDFEDNTVVNNGFSSGVQYAGNTIKLERDGGNTYMHWVADSQEATNHGHFNINISPYLPDKGSLVVRFKIKTDDVSGSSRTAVAYRPYDYHNGADIIGSDGEPLGYGANMFTLATLGRRTAAGGYEAALGLLDTGNKYSASSFKDVAVIYTWTDKTNVTASAFYEGDSTPVNTLTTVSKGYDARPCYFRFQVSGGTGLEWDLDDLLIFTSTS
ncbi:MAG: hypothetical protein IJY24_04035 [Clostridia bacterium]|nr:hypothetical protein [Clostridia bacterium]